MGEIFKEVDLKEVVEKNPGAYEVLKSVYSVYAHDKRLPLNIRELGSREKIPEVFIDGRIILGRTKSGDYSLLLFNPKIIHKIGVSYIKCSDIYPGDCDLIERDNDGSPIIALRHMDKSNILEDKIYALDDTTRMEQIKEKSGNALRKSVQVGGKAVKVTGTAGKKAAPVVGKAVRKVGRIGINVLAGLDPDKYYDSGR